MASILLHEYHHYLIWLKGEADVPEKIPDFPSEFTNQFRGEGELTPLERWIWYRAMIDLKEFLSTLP
jgi:hypothetical protein